MRIAVLGDIVANWDQLETETESQIEFFDTKKNPDSPYPSVDYLNVNLFDVILGKDASEVAKQGKFVGNITQGSLDSSFWVPGSKPCKIANLLNPIALHSYLIEQGFGVKADYHIAIVSLTAAGETFTSDLLAQTASVIAGKSDEIEPPQLAFNLIYSRGLNNSDTLDKSIDTIITPALNVQILVSIFQQAKLTQSKLNQDYVELYYTDMLSAVDLNIGNKPIIFNFRKTELLGIVYSVADTVNLYTAYLKEYLQNLKESLTQA